MHNDLMIELMQWKAHSLRGSLVDNKKKFLGRGKGTWRIKQKCNTPVTVYSILLA